ncbi:MAG: Radical SAM superfamily protein [bacterium ADurb.Bin400]|nr:MAG: Radical SAM superfamily protein [bacterium ADurb.Bin400]
MVTELIKTQAKEIFTKTRLPGADWVINQYVGCEHNCNYCYAKFMSRWKKHGQWGGWVEAKTNAPELVRGRYLPGWIFMSSVSDPYQPIEKDLRLTRRILENLDKRCHISILTKSDLVMRDIDPFKEFSVIEVGLTINSFSGSAKQLFEPDSPDNEKRIEALKVLKQNGIKTYCFISPIIPGLIDVCKIIDATREYTDYYWFEFINTSGAGREFVEKLHCDYPDSYRILKDRDALEKYMSSLSAAINSSKIQVRGMEFHHR